GPAGGDDERVDPALVERVLQGVAGEGGRGQQEAAVGPAGVDAGRAGHGDRLVGVDVHVAADRVAAAAVAQDHAGPRGGVAGEVNADAADGAVEDLQVGGRAGAAGGEHDVGGVAGLQQRPVLARVHAAPDAAVGPAQGHVDDHLAAGRRFGIDNDLEGGGADENVVALVDAGAGDVDAQDVALGVGVVRAVE